MSETSERPTPPVEDAPIGTAVRPSLGTRLWFTWGALWAFCSLAVFSLCHFIEYRFQPTAGTFKRWAGRWGRTVLGGTGLRVEVAQHVELDPEQPYVFVVNHQNALDILVLGGYLPFPFGFVAKAELARWPLLGFTLRHSPSLFIDRSHPRKSMASIQEAGRRIRDGISVLIFAEGARSYAPNLLPFKKGAFVLAVEAGVPLVPVTLVNAYRFLDERRYAGRSGAIRLVIGQPIAMADKRRRDIPALMETVRAQMERELAAEARRTPHRNSNETVP